MLKLKEISLLLIILSVMIFSGCAENQKSSVGNINDSSATYTITFNSNGAESGSIEDINAKDGQQVELPENTFVKTDYRFIGWAESTDGAVVYPNASYITVTKNITLYAVWEKIESNVTAYTITLHSGYDNTKEVVSVNFGEPYTLSSSIFTRDGYVITGWSLKENGEISYKDNTAVDINYDIDLYAVWQSSSAVIEKYTVTFNGNGAVSGDISPVEVEKGQNIILPANTFTKSGYVFAGWSTSPDGEIVYQDKAEISQINSNITLYAVWQSAGAVTEKYTITFNGNDAQQGSMNTVEVVKGGSVTLPENKFTKTGFIFTGWSTSLGGQVVYQDKAIVEQVSKNITLYAVWEYDKNSGVEFKVTFDTNGGTGQYDCRNYYETRIYGGEIFLPYTTCQKENLVFLGWAKQSDTQDVLYKDGQIITVTEDMDLYAVWADKQDAFVVTFNKNDGKGFGPSYLAAKKGNSIVLPAVDNWKRDNYVPIGYASNTQSSGTIYKEKTEYTPQDDVTLYVAWHDGSDKEHAGQKRWAYGVNGDNTQWVGVGQRYRGLWTSDANWYDTFQEGTDMCWAASSSNIVLWWYNNNKAYIEKYKEQGHDIPDFTYTTETGKNSIFEIFKQYMLNDGNQPPVAFNYFLVGNSNYQKGAYFKDVFMNAPLAETISFADRANFNAKMKEAFDNNKMVSMDITTGGAHIITIWGVEYNDEGFINKLYLTDSATKQLEPSYVEPKQQYGDMVEATIEYHGSAVYIKYENYSLYNIKKIYFFPLGKDIWEAYFNKK